MVKVLILELQTVLGQTFTESTKIHLVHNRVAILGQQKVRPGLREQLRPLQDQILLRLLQEAQEKDHILHLETMARLEEVMITIAIIHHHHQIVVHQVDPIHLQTVVVLLLGAVAVVLQEVALAAEAAEEAKFKKQFYLNYKIIPY